MMYLQKTSVMMIRRARLAMQDIGLLPSYSKIVV